MAQTSANHRAQGLIRGLLQKFPSYSMTQVLLPSCIMHLQRSALKINDDSPADPTFPFMED